jgi:hypothetical protein
VSNKSPLYEFIFLNEKFDFGMEYPVPNDNTNPIFSFFHLFKDSITLIQLMVFPLYPPFLF